MSDKPPDPGDPDVQTPESIQRAKEAQQQERADVYLNTGLRVSHDGQLIRQRETFARTLQQALGTRPLEPEAVWHLADARLALAQLVTHFGAVRIMDWLGDEAEAQSLKPTSPATTTFYCPGCDSRVLHGPNACGFCGTRLRCQHCGANQCLESLDYACDGRRRDAALNANYGETI